MVTDRNTVITVDNKDTETGMMEKQAAHQAGVLHRAFSIFILNDNNELLLQQRADSKYHSGSLWTNTCCSHPMPGETTDAAAHRRLKEELGIETTLHPIFSFTYKADVGHGLTEHEFDHVYTGTYNGDCNPDPAEVKAYKYIDLAALSEWMQQEPGAFTAWMHIAFPMFRKYQPGGGD
jgi:isopentenyl-diphosphate delta-isomerase